MYKRQKSGLYLAEVSSDEELKEICNIFVTRANVGMLPYSIPKGLIEFRIGIAKGNYVRAIYLDNTLVGFIAACINTPYFCPEKVLQQVYYICDLDGMQGMRAVVMAHEALINYAEGQKIPYILATCSPLDTDNKLALILEKRGWRRFGYAVVWNCSTSDVPSGLKP